MSGSTLLEPFLDFTFFLFISPFRIHRKGPQNPATICQWRPHKVFAAFMAILDIFGAITRIRLNLDSKLDNPVGYFTFMWSIAAFLMHLSFYFVLWTKHNQILKVVQLFSKAFSNSTKSTFPWKRVFGFGFCGLSLFLGLLPTLKGSYILPHHPNPTNINWSPSNVFKAHVAHSKFMFFLSNSSIPSQNSNGSDSEELEVSEVIGGIGHILIYTSRYLGAYFIDLFMILSALTFWLAVKHFVQNVTRVDFHPGLLVRRCDSIATSEEITSPGSLKRNLMVEKYGDLKSLSTAINDWMSPILFCYVFEGIFYHATNLNLIFTATGWHARLQVAHFLLGIAAVFGFSADVTRKMDGFRMWLVNSAASKSGVRDERLDVLIHETQSRAIGVSSYGIFTLDYPLIFNIVTTTVTFFLIVVQFVPTSCNS